jgi:UDP:flavonoid glycosyltransferase YjiC (YdhE family)
VCTAGNQLVGEALHFGKPVLACPEVGNREQEINARLLAASGAGCWMPFDRLDERALREFLATCTERAHPSLCADGVHAAVRAIEAQLPGRVRVSAPAVAVPA